MATLLPFTSFSSMRDATLDSKAAAMLAKYSADHEGSLEKKLLRAADRTEAVYLKKRIRTPTSQLILAPMEAAPPSELAAARPSSSPAKTSKKAAKETPVRLRQDFILKSLEEKGCHLTLSQMSQVASKLSHEIQSSSDTPPIEILEIHNLVTDFLKMGHAFKGIPIIQNFSITSDSIHLELTWAPSSSPPPAALQIPGTPFFAASGAILTQTMHNKKLVITNPRHIFQLFQFFKRLVPDQYIEDGCNPRCLWVALLLQNLTSIDCYKIKVWTKDGKTPFAVKAPFQKANWLMHTAPVLRFAGKEYVFDLSLDRPIELSAWKKSLFGEDESLVTIATSKHWNQPCLSAADQHPPTDTLEELLDDLRGLYLFQRVNGSDPKVDSWQNWIRRPTGLKPLQDTQKSEKKVQLVYRVTKSSCGKTELKTREILLSPEIRARSVPIGSFRVMKHLVARIPTEMFQDRPVCPTAVKPSTIRGDDPAQGGGGGKSPAS